MLISTRSIFEKAEYGPFPIADLQNRFKLKISRIPLITTIMADSLFVLDDPDTVINRHFRHVHIMGKG
jgi:hypothetical protein